MSTGGAGREELDAVVIGATIRGLVTSYVLSELGFKTVLLERSPRIGGADGSFVTSKGNVFDHGLHVVDRSRSELVTRLFTHIVDGAVHRTVLERAIALRGSVMPYAPEPRQMPEELRRMLPGAELIDEIGDELPTRERLAAVYGPEFTNVVLEEVLPSFPSEARHLEFGVEESRLLTNIYPWFFPRAKRPTISTDESRAFHDLLRAGIPQEVIYPSEGGFGGFARGFLQKLAAARVEIITDASDLHVEVLDGTHHVDWVSTGGRRFSANNYFWGEGWASLCRLLGLPCQDVATDRVVLGSFRFDRPLESVHHEILVGDPALHLNRVHFPGAFRRSTQPLMQVEFAFPTLDERWHTDPDQWRDRWLEDTRRLGLVDVHRVDDFDFRSFVMHFNAFGAEGAPLQDADPALVDAEANVHPVAPSMANLNLNRYVPRVISEVVDAVTG